MPDTSGIYTITNTLTGKPGTVRGTVYYEDNEQRKGLT